MTRLFHTCGTAILYRVECDGLERYCRFQNPETLADLVTCPSCGQSLDRALAGGELADVRPEATA
jgi:hypothetical protein